MVGVDIRPLMPGDAYLTIANHKSNFLFVQADLTKLPDLQLILQRILTTFEKHVHVLINNAGIADPYLLSASASCSSAPCSPST